MTTKPTDRAVSSGPVGDHTADTTIVPPGVPVQLGFDLEVGGCIPDPSASCLEWIDAVGWSALEILAADPEPFTADDVWPLISLSDPGHHSWVGSLILAGSRTGRIVAIGDDRSLRRPRHSGHQRAWIGREHVEAAA